MSKQSTEDVTEPLQPIRLPLGSLWDEIQRQKQDVVSAAKPARKSRHSPTDRDHLSRRQLQELASMEVEEARQAGELSFYTRILAQTTLPHHDPGDVPAWGRQNGHLGLIVQPGMRWEKDKSGKQVLVSIGFPFGIIPRLLIAWVCTRAVQTRSRHLTLDNTMSAFMKELGLSPTGGKQGTVNRFKMQVDRTFSAQITWRYDIRPGELSFAPDLAGSGGGNIGVAENHHVWWDTRRPDEPVLFGSAVLLRETFFEDLMAHPVPLDMRALRFLKRSPLSLDIYVWATHRFSYLRAPASIPWAVLAAQFGSNYGRARDFRHYSFEPALKKVLAVYPEARIDPGEEGVTLSPSPPHVRRQLAASS
jgi:replication initiator protein